MKRYRFLFLLLAALSMTSCLDEHPKDQLDEDAIYGSASDIYINAVASLYNYIGGANESEGIQGTCRGIYDYNTLTTDEAMIPIRGGDWYDGGLWNAMYQHRWSADDQSLYDTWKYLYKVIVLANKSLDIISNKSALLSAAQQEEYRAEIRAIRAMFYYYAMDMFGRVPLVLSSAEQLHSSLFQGQTDRSSIFQFVFQELQQVLPSLPDQHSNKEGNYYGRITQPVVNFLLAKLALNAEIYMYDDWTQGYASRPKGSDIHFSVPASDASLRNGDKVDCRKLNAWETCIYYCDKLAEEDYDLESDDSFISSVSSSMLATFSCGSPLSLIASSTFSISSKIELSSLLFARLSILQWKLWRIEHNLEISSACSSFIPFCIAISSLSILRAAAASLR